MSNASRRTWRFLGVACCTAAATTGLATGEHASAATLHVDTAPNTIIFRDYNAGIEPDPPTYSANMTHGSTTATDWSADQVVANGESVFTFVTTPSGEKVVDPRMVFHDGADTWDHATFPWFRLRFKQSTDAHGSVQAWENPAQGGEGVGLGTATSYVERGGNPDSDANTSVPQPSDGSGFRIDPFGTVHHGDVFSIDYLMMDRFETVGYEFDRDGDADGVAHDARIHNVNVANSIFSAQGTGDTILQLAGHIDANKFKFVEIRIRTGDLETNTMQLFWGADGAYNETDSIRFGADDGEFHTYLIDLSDETNWTGTNMKLRFDPTQNSETDMPFDLDYIRLRTDAITTAAVPAPATLSALIVGMGAVAMRRQRG